MSLFSQILPAIKAIKILGNTELFNNWLQKKHPKTNKYQLFEGYRFSIISCVNSFVYGVSVDSLLQIQNDFLLNRAINELIPIHQIENSCEKTIFLKNLNLLLIKIKKAKSYDELQNEISNFHETISLKFEKIIEKNVNTEKIDKKTAIELSLLDFAHTYMVQINNNGPVANFSNILSTSWTKKELLKKYLKGYSYAIQFLWYSILGETKFNKTSLVNMHLADSWRDYKYIETKNKSEFDMIFNNYYNLEEQTCFDSYFDHITNDVTNKLQKKYKFPIYTIQSYFKFSNNKYDKTEIFAEFLNPSNLPKYKPNFNKKEFQDIYYKLYWYPVEIINSRELQLHSGISNFISMLAGNIALHNPKTSEFSKIIVAKFIHPTYNKNKNAYSYGVLIDTKSTAGHYYSGWKIYLDVCTDYSGFSNAEHKKAEKIIQENLEKNKIELRELTIPLDRFTNFANTFILDNKQRRNIDKSKNTERLISDTRGYILELFTFYIFSGNEYFKENFDIRLNEDANNNDEKDIVLIKKDKTEIILVECKRTPNNQNFNILIPKLISKINKKEYKNMSKSIQLWFWKSLSAQNKRDIEKNSSNISLSTVCISERKHQILRNINLSSLQKIMLDY